MPEQRGDHAIARAPTELEVMMTIARTYSMQPEGHKDLGKAIAEVSASMPPCKDYIRSIGEFVGCNICLSWELQLHSYKLTQSLCKLVHVHCSFCAEPIQAGKRVHFVHSHYRLVCQGSLRRLILASCRLALDNTTEASNLVGQHNLEKSSPSF